MSLDSLAVFVDPVDLVVFVDPVDLAVFVDPVDFVDGPGDCVGDCEVDADL